MSQVDADSKPRRHSEYTMMTSSQSMSSVHRHDSRKLSLTSAPRFDDARNRKVSMPNLGSSSSGYRRLQGLRIPSSQTSSTTEALVSDLPLIQTASSVEDLNITLPVGQRRLTPAQITDPTPALAKRQIKSFGDLNKIIDETEHLDLVDTPNTTTSTTQNFANDEVGK